MENSKLKTRVVIIGAGIAGLRAAKELQSNGIEYIIFEKNKKPGGRIETIEKDGYMLDLGFQVLLDSYDELPTALNLATLDIKSFDSGAIIAQNGTKKFLFDPLQHPKKILSTIFSHPGNLNDIFKILAVSWKASKTNENFFKIRNVVNTARYLQETGFSQSIINGFFKPFFGGVFLETDLQIPSNYFLWLFNKFRKGNACLPANGMGEIGNLMAKQLVEIRFEETVKNIVGHAVMLKSGISIEAEWIVNATGKQDLIFDHKTPNPADFRGTTTLYLKGKWQSGVSKSIVLIADPDSPILHFSFPSEVQKTYAPNGYCLCSVTLKWKGISPDTEKLAASTLKDLAKHYTSIDWNQFIYLAHFDIPYALPKWESGNESTFLVEQNRITIGDHVAYPSINGALRSGREGAEYLIRKIKG